MHSNQDATLPVNETNEHRQNVTYFSNLFLSNELFFRSVLQRSVVANKEAFSFEWSMNLNLFSSVEDIKHLLQRKYEIDLIEMEKQFTRELSSVNVSLAKEKLNYKMLDYENQINKKKIELLLIERKVLLEKINNLSKEWSEIITIAFDER